MKWKEEFKVGEHIQVRLAENEVWYLTHPDKSGKTTTYSTGVKGSKTDIKRWIKEAAIQDLVEVGIRTTLTTAVINRITKRDARGWEELLPEYSHWMISTGRSPSTAERNVEAVRRWIKDEGLENTKPYEVTEAHVYNWLNHTLKTKLSSRKVMHQSVRSMFDYLTGFGYAERNVAANTGIRQDLMTIQQMEPRMVGAFTKDEFAKLVAYLARTIDETRDLIVNNPYKGWKRVAHRNMLESTLSYLNFFYSAVHISYSIGLRRGDVVGMEWDSLTAIPGWIVVYTDKSDFRVAIPFNESAISEFLEESVSDQEREAVGTALREMAPFLKEGIRSIEQDDEIDLHYCFPKWRQEYVRLPSKFSVYFTRILQRAGLNGKSFHALRRSRIRAWNKLGISLETIGKFVGHRNTKTTEGYLEKKECSRRLAQLRAGSRRLKED
jgi:integrase